MKTIILDSSVIIKWYFPDEIDKKALILQDKVANNFVSLAAPILLYYEINNILKTAIKANRIEIEKAVDAYNALLQLNIVVYSSTNLFENTLRIATDYDISSYDASYVALAEEMQILFITADKKLLKKVKSKLVVSLEEAIEVL